MSSTLCHWPPVPAESVVSSSATDTERLVGGRYRVVRELGRGGMGIVYLAEDLRLRRRVAIKVLAPDCVSDPGALARFEREAMALAALHHPNIVPIFDVGIEGASRYLVMEYVRGETLAQMQRRLQKDHELLPVASAIDLIAGIASGLDAAHGAGIVHRDISGSNVIVEAETGRPVLTDFGLARGVASAQVSLSIVGTPRYLPPEIVRRTPLPPDRAHLSDVYALGVLAYELLTGRAPFEHDDLVELMRLHRDEIPLAPSAVRRELPASVDAPVLAALEKDPAKRPESCTSFVATLKLARDVTIRARAPVRSSSPRRTVLLATPDTEFATRLDRVVERWLAPDHVLLRWAPDGVTAWAMAQEIPPHVLLASLDLPELNVVELIGAMAGTPATADTPVGVLSARAISAADRMLFDRLGVRRIVRPDVEDAQLVALLRALLAVTRAARPT